MTPQKVMILGGGQYQLPLIKSSKEHGYYTIVCGITGNFPGYIFADKWYDINILDYDSCIEIAKKEKINAVCVCGSDFVLPSLGKIVDACGLNGPSFNSSLIASNKLLMKEAFVKNNVRTAKYYKINNFEDCQKAALAIGFPVVLKVVDASGSKGVSIVNTEETLKQIYDSIVKFTTKDYIIAEEFISGTEFGAQAFVYNNELQFVLPHGDIIFKSETGVPIGHYAPYKEVELFVDDIKEQLLNAIAALNINDCAINADFILKNDKVYVLEIGARAGATCLPELVSQYYNVDYYEYIIKAALGEKLPSLSTNHKDCVVYTLLSLSDGVIKNIKPIKNNVNVVDFKLYPKIGDTVNAFKNAYDRIGHVVLCGSNLPNLLSQLESDFINTTYIDL